MSAFDAPRWTKNDNTILMDSRVNTKQMLGMQLTRIQVLKVENCSPEDTGTYRCNSFSRASHRIEVIATNLDVKKDEEESKKEKSYEVLEQENSEVTITCPSVGDNEVASVLW
jgi:hypothetical protein